MKSLAARGLRKDWGKLNFLIDSIVATCHYRGMNKVAQINIKFLEDILQIIQQDKLKDDEKIHAIYHIITRKIFNIKSCSHANKVSHR